MLKKHFHCFDRKEEKNGEDKRLVIPFFYSQFPFTFFTHFLPMLLFYTSWKRQKTINSLVFSGAIKWEHWS